MEQAGGAARSWRTFAVAGPGVLAALLVLAGHALAGAALLVLSASLALSPRWRSVPATVPAAFVGCVAFVTFVAAVGGLVGLRPLSGPWPARTVLALLGLGTAALAAFHLHRLGGGSASTAQRPPRILWMVPGLLMGLLALVPLTSGAGSTSGWVFGGDHVRHLVFVARTQQDGWLDYSSATYPRGWHSALASLWAVAGGELDGRGFAALATIQAVACWTAFAVLSLAVARCAVVLSEGFVVGEVARDAVGFVAGATVLTPIFARDYLALGFETSVVAALSLVVTTLALVERLHRFAAVTTVAASFLLVAHSWQLLLPGAGVALVLVSNRWWRQGARRPPIAGPVCVLAVVLASTGPLLATAQFGGVNHGAVGGILPTSAAPWAGLGLVALAALAVRRPGAPSLRRYALIVVVTAAIGPLLAVYVSVPLSSYYPNKTLWVTAVLLVPATVLGWCVLLLRVNRMHGPARVVLVPLGVVTGLIAVLGLASPITALRGSWSAVDGGQVVRAMTAPGADRAQVFWSAGPYVFDATVQSLLPFYAAAGPGYDPSLPRDNLFDECRLLKEASAPVVLTTESPATVERRFSCAPDVVVVRVPR